MAQVHPFDTLNEIVDVALRRIGEGQRVTLTNEDRALVDKETALQFQQALLVGRSKWSFMVSSFKLEYSGVSNFPEYHTVWRPVIAEGDWIAITDVSPKKGFEVSDFSCDIVGTEVHTNVDKKPEECHEGDLIAMAIVEPPIASLPADFCCFLIKLLEGAFGRVFGGSLKSEVDALEFANSFADLITVRSQMEKKNSFSVKR